MKYTSTLLLVGALMTPGASVEGQDHQHAAPDSAATSDSVQPPADTQRMQMMGMMGHIMSAMAEMHEMMCTGMMSSSTPGAPSDSADATPMGMMGQMMKDMARMMTMMSQGGAMHGHAMGAPESTPTP